MDFIEEIQNTENIKNIEEKTPNIIQENENINEKY